MRTCWARVGRSYTSLTLIFPECSFIRCAVRTVQVFVFRFRFQNFSPASESVVNPIDSREPSPVILASSRPHLKSDELKPLKSRCIEYRTIAPPHISYLMHHLLVQVAP
jgi:hypothetical protein